jgi:hypothetical protein
MKKVLCIIFCLSVLLVSCNSSSVDETIVHDNQWSKLTIRTHNSDIDKYIENQNAKTISIALIIYLIVYFIPTLVARLRHHNNKLAIIVLNILAGWTAIGWLVALVWSCTDNVERRIRKG